MEFSHKSCVQIGALAATVMRLLMLFVLIWPWAMMPPTSAAQANVVAPATETETEPAPDALQPVVSLPSDPLAALMPYELAIPKQGEDALLAGGVVLLDNSDIVAAISGDSTINKCERKYFTYSISNIGTLPLTNVVATVHAVNLTGFDYVTSTASLDIDGAAFCTANPQISGTDLIWDIDTACGITQTLDVNETLNITFALDTDCSAVSGSLNGSVAYQRGLTPVTDNQAVMTITVLPGAIQVHKMPTFAPAAVGDQVTYTIWVENTGLGVIENVEVTDVLGAGLTYVSSTQDGLNAGQTTTWTSTEYPALAFMGPGDILTMDITVGVIACQDLSMVTDARWGCEPSPGATCYDTATDGGTAVTAVQRIPETPKLAYSPPNVTFDYCQDHAEVAFLVTNQGDGPAYEVWLLAEFDGLTVSNVSAGASYNTVDNRFEIAESIPPGGSYPLSFYLTNSAWCDEFPAQDITWQPTYLDACHNIFYPPVMLSSINAPADSASLSVSLEGAPGIIEYGDMISYDIVSEYSGPVSCGGSVGLVTVTDTVPAGWTVFDAGSGTWTPGAGGTGGEIVWSYTPPLSLTTNITLSPPADQCETYCNTGFTNRVDATGLDCCGCAITDNDTSATVMECQEGVVSDKTNNGTAERCDSVAYTNTYTFDGDSSVVLSDLVFTEEADMEQEYVGGSLAILLSGSGDITGVAAVNDTTPGAGGTLLLDFSGAAATPLAGQTLTISYDMLTTEATQAACSSGSFVSWSTMNMGPTGSECLADGILHEATITRVQAPDMEVSVTGLGQILSKCELSTVTINLSRSSAIAQPKDVKLVLSGLNYFVVNPASVVCTGDVVPVSCTPTIDGGGNYVWTFGDAFVSNGDVATLQLDVEKRCTGGGELVATAYYDDLCTDDATPDELCSAQGSDTPALLVSGDLLIEVTPEEYLATTNQATWKIHVTNRGSGDANNVWVDLLLGSGLDHASATVTGGSTTPAQDHDGAAMHGASISIPQIAAGTRQEITYVADLVGCTDMTLDATTSFGCVGVDCQAPVSDNSEVYVPTPLLVTTNTVATPVDACTSTAGNIVFRNAGSVMVYALEAVVTPPAGMTYVSGTTRYRLDGGTWNGPNVAYDPVLGAGQMTWATPQISAMAALTSGSNIEIEYHLASDCAFTGGTVTVDATYENPCGQVFAPASSNFTVILTPPSLEVGVTRADDPISCGDSVTWDVYITNTSGYNLPIVYVQDVLGGAFDYNLAGTDWDGPYAGITPDVQGQTISWELTDLTGGAVAHLTIYATSDSAPCNAELTHTLNVRWGCGAADGDASTVPGVDAPDDALCLDSYVYTDTYTSTREPDLTFTDISILPTSVDACSDSTEVTIVIENTGPTDATDLDLVVTLPTGLSYVAGSAAVTCGGSLNDPAPDPAIAGGTTLTFYDTGLKADDLCDLLQAAGGNDEIIFKFSVESSCYVPGNMGLTLYYYDCCSDEQYTATDSFQLGALYPQLTITKTPLTQQVDCNDLITWTLNVANTGTGTAQVVVVEDTLGDWFDYVSSDSTVGGAATNMGGGTYGWEFNTLAPAATEVLTITARLNPDTQDSCSVALRQNNARTFWACGAGVDAVDGDPTTSVYDCSASTPVNATAATAQMPNLRVTDITPQITCQSDGTVSGSVVVTVRNIGDAPTLSGFTVQVADGKGWTGTGNTPSVLAPNTNRDVTINTATWTPACQPCDATYAFSATVDSLGEVCECDETNNTRTESYLVPIPELSVSDLDFTQVSCSSDSITGTVRVQVQNTGCISATDIAVQLATDGCLTFDNQTITTLEAESSTWVTFTMASGWADCLDNACDFTAIVDPLGAICECDGSNNTRTEPYSTTLPDLIVTSVDTSGVNCVDDSVGGVISVTVKNQGYGTPSSIPVALASDGCLTFDDQTITGPLGHDATYTVGFAVSDWGDCGDASCALTATVDLADLICECDGTNNTASAVLNSGLPNLYVDSVTPSVPCVADGPKSGTVSVVVGNEGVGNVAGAVVQLVSTCGHVFSNQTADLAAGVTTTLTFNYTPTTANCTCTFIATIDPANAVCECDNSDNTAMALNYVSPVAELTVTDIDFGSLSCASDGITGTVRVSVQNTGCGPAAMVRVRLGTDGCLTFADRVVSLLGPSASATVLFTPTLGWADCTVEDCDFTAAVDPLHAICEFDGTNNTRTEPYSTTLPDLVVTDIDLSGVVCANDEINRTLTVTVQNQGFGSADDFQVSLVSDGCLGFDAQTVSSALTNDQSTEVTFVATGPWADCAATSCVFTATVDSGDVICECNGDNNQRQETLPSSAIDLVVNSVTPNATCTGDDISTGTVLVNVSNEGAGDATGAVLRVTNSCGYVIGDQTVSLAAGTNQNISFYWTPVTATCSCVFTATIDPDNAICECTSTNNALASDSYTADLPALRVAGDDLLAICAVDGSLTVSGTLTVANDGCGANHTADVPVRVTLYDQSGCAGTVLGQYTKTINAVDIPAKGTQALTLPSETLAVGGQLSGCDLSALVELDYSGTICEYDGANNSACVELDNPLPDLVVSDNELELACVGDAASRVQGRIQVGNTGCEAVSSTATVSFTLYSAADCAGSQLDQWAESVTLDVAADGTQWINIANRDLIGNMCNVADLCQLSLRVELDTADDVCEASGENNADCINLAVDISDLTVTRVDYFGLDAGSLQGRVEVWVQNDGCGDVTSAMVTVTSDCGPVFDPQYVDLTAGQSSHLTWYFDPPTCTTCECEFTAVIDAPGTICECDETNNMRTSSQEDLYPILSMSKTTPRRTVFIGELINYTLVVSNTGDANAAGVVISDELASGLEYVGPVTLEGSLGWVAQSAADLPELAGGITVRAGRRVTVTLPVRVTGMGPIRNLATAGTPGGLTPPVDDDEEILALALPTSMTGCVDPFCPGWTLRYSFWITNTLPDVLTDLVVWDDLPAEVCCPSDVAWNGQPFEVSGDERRVTWHIPAMQPGESLRLGVGLHTYPHLAHGTLVENVITYEASQLGEPQSETIVLKADTTICGQPEPTPDLGPTPTPGLLPLYMPLLLKG